MCPRFSLCSSFVSSSKSSVGRWPRFPPWVGQGFLGCNHDIRSSFVGGVRIGSWIHTAVELVCSRSWPPSISPPLLYVSLAFPSVCLRVHRFVGLSWGCFVPFPPSPSLLSGVKSWSGGWVPCLPLGWCLRLLVRLDAPRSPLSLL